MLGVTGLFQVAGLLEALIAAITSRLYNPSPVRRDIQSSRGSQWFLPGCGQGG